MSVEECELKTLDGNPANAERVVILVHGTSSSEADWPKLIVALRAGLDSAAIYQFIWSGKNTHEARYEGGAALRCEIAGLRNQSSSKRIDVIAHSHGGNVLMYAMKGADDSWDSAVCLATPFLHVLKKKTNKGLAWFQLPGNLGILALAGLAWKSGLYVGSVLLFALSLLVVGTWIAFTAGRFRTSIVKDVGRLELPEPEQGRLLILRPVGDEAAGILDSAHFASLILRKLWAVTERLVERSFTTFVLVAGPLAMLTWIVSLLGRDSDGFWGDLANSLFLGEDNLFAVFVLGLSLTWMAVALVFSLLILAQLPFGWDGAFLSLDARTSVEDTPLGEQTIRQIVVQDKAGLGLNHCRVYNEDKVIAAVLEFLQRPCDEAQLARPMIFW